VLVYAYGEDRLLGRGGLGEGSAAPVRDGFWAQGNVTNIGRCARLCGSVGPRSALLFRGAAHQWSWVLIEVNLVLRVAPIFLTTPMITKEMPAAIRPYSMAVAPDSSPRKRKTAVRIGAGAVAR
jgi:hypothetical protein